MAFITKVRLEAAGRDPGAIKAALDAAVTALEKHSDDAGQMPNTRVTDEVYERVKNENTKEPWYKARCVAWFVQPNGPNDPDAGNPVSLPFYPSGTSGASGVTLTGTTTSPVIYQNT